MIKYLKVGDYVKVDYLWLGPKFYNLGKIKRIELTNASGRKVGQEVPSVAYNTEDAVYQSPFSFEYYTGTLSVIYIKNAHSNELMTLTEEEERDLAIYLSGDFDKYPLIINNPYLKEAVSERLKHNIKPEPNGTFL